MALRDVLPSYFLSDPYHDRNDVTPSSDTTAGISELQVGPLQFLPRKEARLDQDNHRTGRHR